MTWQASDPEGDALTFAVYFGTASPPPLVASGLTQPAYVPGTLAQATPYYWRIESSDGSATTGGPTWNFTALAGGDVNGDGQLTVDDARCALQLALGASCGGSGASVRADVDCSNFVTPRDARCIHKQVVDGSCPFCGGTAQAPATDVLIPSLWTSATWAVGDTLITQVFLSGVPSLEAFAFFVYLDPNVYLARAVRIGATLGWQGLLTIPPPVWFLPARVGGYTLGSVPANSAVALVELHFVLTSGESGYARLAQFVDDLAGAPDLLIRVGRDEPTPVLISRFEAVRSGSDVEVRWDYSSDEPIARYTLYRRDEGAALPVAIAQGVDPSARSFVDRTVQASTTYRYELVVRTRAGGEYRSPTATVTTAAMNLSLGQNHPNPFNPQTTIPFDVPGNSTRVRLFVLDAGGRVVRTLVDENMPGGSHATIWDGRDTRGNAVSSGVYFYVLDVGGERRTRKMVLLK